MYFLLDWQDNNLGAYISSPPTLAHFQRIAELELGKVLGAEDAPACMRLLINDASTYDVVARTGGVNGSVIKEMDRPENKALQPLVAKLTKGKAAIDATIKNRAVGGVPISWADTIVMAAKVGRGGGGGHPKCMRSCMLRITPTVLLYAWVDAHPMK
jgi:hypothetical protein